MLLLCLHIFFQNWIPPTICFSEQYSFAEAYKDVTSIVLMHGDVSDFLVEWTERDELGWPLVWTELICVLEDKIIISRNILTFLKHCSCC